MKEIVVLSGKGGTGKTSVLASFAALASPRAVLADCDVDAADLHLVLAPVMERSEPFYSGHEAEIDPERCTGCGRCAGLCRFHAIRPPQVGGSGAPYRIDPVGCEGCGVCVRACPAGAIRFPPRRSGDLYVSSTRHGTLVHARLGVAAENSGKLVTAVRAEAKRRATAQGAEFLLVDGPPGIGCPVIASLGGADLAVAVTEPTPSGEHDLARLLDLAAHFRIPVAVCVNKWDIHPAMAERIEGMARARGQSCLGRIRYDAAVTKAQIEARAVTEGPDSDPAREIRAAWKSVQELVTRTKAP